MDLYDEIEVINMIRNNATDDEIIEYIYDCLRTLDNVEEVIMEDK